MPRRPTSRFAWIALLIAAIALPGSAVPGGHVLDANAFFLCTANGTRTGGEPPRDTAPAGDHSAGGAHCPLCLTPGGATAFTAPGAHAVPMPPPAAPVSAPASLASATRPLDQARAQPPPAAS